MSGDVYRVSFATPRASLSLSSTKLSLDWQLLIYSTRSTWSPAQHGSRRWSCCPICNAWVSDARWSIKLSRGPVIAAVLTSACLPASNASMLMHSTKPSGTPELDIGTPSISRRWREDLSICVFAARLRTSASRLRQAESLHAAEQRTEMLRGKGAPLRRSGAQAWWITTPAVLLTRRPLARPSPALALFAVRRACRKAIPAGSTLAGGKARRF